MKPTTSAPLVNIGTTVSDNRTGGQLLNLDMCRETGRDPFRHFSGKFNVRIGPALHARAVELAAAKGVSLNQLVEEAIQHEVAA